MPPLVTSRSLCNTSHAASDLPCGDASLAPGLPASLTRFLPLLFCAFSALTGTVFWLSVARPPEAGCPGLMLLLVPVLCLFAGC